MDVPKVVGWEIKTSREICRESYEESITAFLSLS
jgi:hypothetical protein